MLRNNSTTALRRFTFSTKTWLLEVMLSRVTRGLKWLIILSIKKTLTLILNPFVSLCVFVLRCLYRPYHNESLLHWNLVSNRASHPQAYATCLQNFQRSLSQVIPIQCPIWLEKSPSFFYDPTPLSTASRLKTNLFMLLMCVQLQRQRALMLM